MRPLVPVTRARAMSVVLLALVCLLCAACGSRSTAHRQQHTATKPPVNTPAPAGTSPPPVGPTSPTAPSRTGAVIGIGDNKTEIFTDPRFIALGITEIRDDVPWDVLRSAYTRNRLAAWLAGARADHLTPLISFDHSGRRGQQRSLPTVAQYSKAFVKLHALYPWVSEFITWDEANFYSEPTASNPQRVVDYYDAIRSACPHCTVLAADLLDIDNPRYAVPEVEWARAFIADAHTQPAYWALNDYVGANDLDAHSTRQLLGAVKGNIWLTETAGIVSDRAHAGAASAASLNHEAVVDRFILGTLATLSPRIQRVYLYEWNAQTAHDAWDSALISPRGVPRPAYDVLADSLTSRGVKPNCAISKLPPACAAAVKR
jgi:hypothetical protein